MNNAEFKTIMQPVIEHFGDKEFGRSRCDLIFTRVHTLDVIWFKRITSRMVVANDRFFNFDEAARNEINNRKSVQFANDVSAAAMNLSETSDEGLQKALAKMGVKSLTEAIEQVKNQPAKVIDEKWYQK